MSHNYEIYLAGHRWSHRFSAHVPARLWLVLVQVSMRKLWKDISEGVRVEVLNTDSGLNMKVYWIAAVVKLAGTHTHTHTLTLWVLLPPAAKTTLRHLVKNMAA